MGNHIERTNYGDSHKEYNVWRFIYSVQCMETHIMFTMYGYSYRVQCM